MLLVEQNTVIALRHCSRAAVMVGGRIVLEGAAEELADREALVASYLGEEPALEREEARRQETVPEAIIEIRRDVTGAGLCYKNWAHDARASTMGGTP